MSHKDGNARCLVYHGGMDPCIKCAYCNEWIRPDYMDQECPKDGVLSADYIELTEMMGRIRERRALGEAKRSPVSASEPEPDPHPLTKPKTSQNPAKIGRLGENAETGD